MYVGHRTVKLRKLGQLSFGAAGRAYHIAYSHVGSAYGFGGGVDEDMKKAEHYWELAAIAGEPGARDRLAMFEGQRGNTHRA